MEATASSPRPPAGAEITASLAQCLDLPMGKRARQCARDQSRARPTACHEPPAWRRQASRYVPLTAREW